MFKRTPVIKNVAYAFVPSSFQRSKVLNIPSQMTSFTINAYWHEFIAGKHIVAYGSLDIGFDTGYLQARNLSSDKIDYQEVLKYACNIPGWEHNRCHRTAAYKMGNRKVFTRSLIDWSPYYMSGYIGAALGKLLVTPKDLPFDTDGWYTFVDKK